MKTNMEHLKSKIYLSDNTIDSTSDTEVKNCIPLSCQNAIGNARGSKNEIEGNENFSFHIDETSYSECPYAYSTNPQKYDDSKLKNIKGESDNEFIRSRSYTSSTSTESSLLSRTSEQRSGNHRVCFIICIQIFTFLVFVSLINVLFVMLFDLQYKLESETSERRKESNKLCMPCNELYLGPLEEDNENLNLLSREIDDGVEVCCAKGWNQTSILIEVFFKRREKLNHANDIIQSESNCKCNTSDSNDVTNDNSPRTAGHLLMGVQPDKTGSSPYTVRNWIRTGATTHASGIQVKDSQIIIDASGLYLVYSQIYFNSVYKGQPLQNTSQVLYHYVYRWNIIYPNGGHELLLKSVRTQCWAENRVYGDYTSYTAGVFKLNAGDNLYVQSSNLEILSREQHATFIGITQL